MTDSFNTLIVFSHPEPDSLTASLAAAVAALITNERPEAEVTVADLHAEGFDPRIQSEDLAAYRGMRPVPDEILLEQRRIAVADHLVLIFPVYWWGFPSLMKGWIDRTFTTGWYSPEVGQEPSTTFDTNTLIHLFALAAGSKEKFTKRAYDESMWNNIALGVFDYIGATVRSSEIVHSVEVEEVDLAELAADVCRRVLHS